jgi:hypothetical protein
MQIGIISETDFVSMMGCAELHTCCAVERGQNDLELHRGGRAEGRDLIT